MEISAIHLTSCQHPTSDSPEHIHAQLGWCHVLSTTLSIDLYLKKKKKKENNLKVDLRNDEVVKLFEFKTDQPAINHP